MVEPSISSCIPKKSGIYYVSLDRTVPHSGSQNIAAQKQRPIASTRNRVQIISFWTKESLLISTKAFPEWRHALLNLRQLSPSNQTTVSRASIETTP